MKTTKKNIFFTVSLLLTLLFSCKKFVDIEPSPQLIATEAVFSTDATAVSAVNGVYVQMRTGSPYFANGGIAIYTALTGDEIYNTATSATYDPFASNSIPASNSNLSSMFWAVPYNTIYRCNAILEGLNLSTGITPGARDQLIGEMLIVRSLTYFYLLNLYGDVPMPLTADYKSNVLLGRSPLAQVYRQITSDVLKAKSLLSDNYPVAGKIRPNRSTATALLARLYQFQGEWANAELASTELIGSSRYSLVNDLTRVFLINSNETIWEVAPLNNARNTAEAAVFTPTAATARPAFSLRENLLNNFSLADKRRTNWLASNTVSAVRYFYPSKYKNISTTSITEYNVVFRLAEQYLIRAEAITRQGKDLAAARQDLEITRSRAGLSPLGALNREQLLEEIYKERQLEYFCEWGFRWLDLKRNETINAVLGNIKVGWKPAFSLFPLPQNQLNLNSNLVQNPEY